MKIKNIIKNIFIYILLTFGATGCMAETDSEKAVNVVKQHWQSLEHMERYKILDVKLATDYNYVVVSRFKPVNKKPYIVWHTVDGSIFKIIGTMVK